MNMTKGTYLVLSEISLDMQHNHKPGRYGTGLIWDPHLLEKDLEVFWDTWGYFKVWKELCLTVQYFYNIEKSKPNVSVPMWISVKVFDCKHLKSMVRLSN